MIRRALWAVAIVAWACALLLHVVPAFADGGTGVIANQFTWGQVCVLLAVAAAWGEMRGQVKNHHERIKKLEDRGTRKKSARR